MQEMNGSPQEDMMLTQPVMYKVKFDENVKVSKEIERDYNKIHEVIKKLEEKIGGIIKSQEDDFMIAFKEQMHDIQKELKTMKRKIDEETLRQKADEKKRILEEERDYFREEALRLDKLCQDQLRTIEELKFKLKITNEEKNYYEGFVIDSKKENKALKFELLQLYKSKMEEQKQQQAVSIHRKQIQRPFTQEGVERVQTSSNKTHSAKGIDLQSTQQDLNRNQMSSQQQSRFNQDMYKIQEEQAYLNSADLFATQTQAQFFQKGDDIQAMKAQLQKDKQIIQQLKVQCSKQNIQRGELEQILLDCVANMKKEIYARQLQQKQGLGAKFDQEQVNFTQFTGADKKQLLRNFLLSEEFLDKLYSLTFNTTKLNEKWKSDAKEALKMFTQFKSFKLQNISSQPMLGNVLSKRDVASSYNNFTEKTRGLIQKVKDS